MNATDVGGRERGDPVLKIDPRGQRFAAALTALVLVAVLITSSVWLLAAQAVVFGIGAVLGLKYAPYGLIYRWLVRPRLGPQGQITRRASGLPRREDVLAGVALASAGPVAGRGK